MQNRPKNQGKHRKGHEANKTPEWEELKGLSSQVGATIGALIKQAKSVSEVCLVPRVREEVLGEESFKRLEANLGAMANDLVALSNDYKTISAKHERRHGYAKGDEDTMSLLTLGIEYDELKQRVTAVGLTTAADIMIEFTERLNAPEVQGVIKEIDALRRSAEQVEKSTLGDK